MKLFHGWQVFVGLHQENLPPPPVFICRNYHRLPVVVFLVVTFLHFHLPDEMRIHKCISFVEECKWLLNDHGKRATDFSLEGFFGTLCCKEWTEHFYLHIEKVQTMDCMWGYSALATQNASSQQAFTLGQKTSTVVGIFVARQKRRYCYLSNGCEQYLGENRTELKMVVTHIVTDK